MHPPIDIVLRECTKNFQIPHTDVVNEAGTPILLPIAGLTYYDDPKEFQLERFLDDQSGKQIDEFSFYGIQ